MLEREAERLRSERQKIIEELHTARAHVLAARQDEIHPVVVGGREFRPIEAAMRVKHGVGIDDWIPGPVE